MRQPATERVRLAVVAREWGRIGCIGFGGPPAHIALLRELCVERRQWLSAREFEDGIAATNLLPGPASTQLAIYCAAGGDRGGLLASLVAFGPSFAFVLIGAPHFERLRANTGVQHFLTGAGAAAIGAIAGSAIGLGLELEHLWQVGVLALATALLLGLHRGVVSALLVAAVLGVMPAWTGAPIGA